MRRESCKTRNTQQFPTPPHLFLCFTNGCRRSPCCLSTPISATVSNGNSSSAGSTIRAVNHSVSAAPLLCNPQIFPGTSRIAFISRAGPILPFLNAVNLKAVKETTKRKTPLPRVLLKEPEALRHLPWPFLSVSRRMRRRVASLDKSRVKRRLTQCPSGASALLQAPPNIAISPISPVFQVASQGCGLALLGANWAAPREAQPVSGAPTLLPPQRIESFSAPQDGRGKYWNNQRRRRQYSPHTAVRETYSAAQKSSEQRVRAIQEGETHEQCRKFCVKNPAFFTRSDTRVVASQARISSSAQPGEHERKARPRRFA